MSITKATLLQRVRNKLKDNYRDRVTLVDDISSSDTEMRFTVNEGGERLSGADLLSIGSEVVRIDENPLKVTALADELTNATTAFTVDSAADLSAGYVLQIDNEKITLTVVNTGTGAVTAERATYDTIATEHAVNASVYDMNAARVERGYMGSTAASAAGGSTVNIVDVWTDLEIERALDDGIGYLNPDFFEEYFTDVFRAPAANANTKFGSDDTAAQVSEWTASLDAVTPALNTTTYKYGTGSIGLGIDASASNSAQATYAISLSDPVNAASADFFNMDFYVKELKDSSDIDIYAANIMSVKIGTNEFNYYETFISRYDVESGTNTISFPMFRGTKEGTIESSEHSALSYCEINIYENPYNASDVASGDITIENLHVTPYPYTNSSQRVSLPKNVYYVGNVDMVENGNKKAIKDFKVVGNDENNDIIFEHGMKQGVPLEIQGARRYYFDDSNTVNIPERLEDFLVIYSAKQLMDGRLPLRMRFDKYSAKEAKENSTQLDHIRINREYQTALNDLKLNHGQALPSKRIDFGQRYG